MFKAFLISFLFGLARLLYIYFFSLELSADEAYYWRWSKTLELSYYDHPPLIAYIIALFCSILKQETALVIRLPAILSCVLLSITVYLFVYRLTKDKHSGILAILLLNSLPLVSVGSIIITPDSFYILFWVIGSIVLYWAKSIHSFCLAGILLGLSLLSKYNAIFFVISVLLYYLSIKRFDKRILIFFLLGSILFLPVIYWNINNNFISFSYQLRHGFASSIFFNINSFTKFILSQVGLVSPLAFLMFVVAIYKSYKIWVDSKEGIFLYLFYNSVVILLFFCGVSLFSKVEGNWPSCGWIFASIATVLVFQKYKKLLYTTILTGYIFSLVLHIHTIKPIIPIKENITTRLWGWKIMTKQVEKIYNKYKHNFLLASDDYAIASQIEFYTKLKKRVYLLGGKFCQYHLFTKNKYLKDKNFILILSHDITPELANSFQKFKIYKIISIYKDNKVIRKIYIYKCYNFIN